MTPKEIGRAAGRIFAKTIPANCAIRNQEDQEDYGIDYELELTDGTDRATGFLFKVQQKGVASLKVNHDGQTISFSDLKVAKAKYYLTQLPLPVAFVVVDVASGTVYWTMLQGIAEIRKEYDDAVANNQQTMTVRLPAANRLPETFNQLLSAVVETNRWLTVQGIKSAASTDLLEAALRGADFDVAAKAIAHHHDIFRSEQIEQLIRARKLDQAVKTAETIFNSPSESTALRFAAAINLLRIKPILIQNNPERIEQNIDWRLKVTHQIFELTRAKNTERRLRLYALFLYRAARLHEVVQQDFGFFLSRQAQQQTADAFLLAMTDAARTPVANAVITEFRHLQRHFLWMIRKGQFELIVPAWIQLVRDLTPFIVRLQSEGLEDSCRRLIEWLDRIGEVAIETSKRLGNWTEVAACAFMTTFSEAPLDEKRLNERFARAKAIIEAVPDDNVRKEALRDLNELWGKIQKPEIPLEAEELAYRRMAAAMGVDLSDEHDKIANIVNIGIRDLNPGRVLKNCRHLFVELQGGGIPAQMLGLPTAGFKTLRCTKFGYGWSALELDSVYGIMYKQHCEKCDACEPHPASWQWTREWQEEQHQLHKKK